MVLRGRKKKTMNTAKDKGILMLWEENLVASARNSIWASVLVGAGIESIFFTGACMVPCFGCVMKTVLITEGC